MTEPRLVAKFARSTTVHVCVAAAVSSLYAWTYSFVLPEDGGQERSGMNENLDNRRPIKSRNAGWAQGGAAWLAKHGFSPDMVSAGAVLFAVLGCSAFITGGMLQGPVRSVLWVLGAACVQLRLICNLLDGLVAVEHRRGGPYGPIWNELPDRIADGLFLVGAGYGAALAGAGWAEPLGWLAAVLAVLTAYIRELGRGLGCAADFSGPGAKPQRMVILTAVAVIGAVEGLWVWSGQSLGAGLGLITLLAMVTAIRRTLHLAAALKARVNSTLH